MPHATKNPITNVIINSNNKIAGTNNSATYNIDWGSILKDRTCYKLHFTYMGGINTFSAAMTNKIPLIFTDIQTTSNKTTSFTGAMSTQFMGYLKIQQVAPNVNGSYLTAEDVTNVPMYLESRPMNNTFKISIFNNANPPVAYIDTASAQPSNYILVLSFEEMY